MSNVIAEGMSVQERISLEAIQSQGDLLNTIIETMKQCARLQITYHKYSDAEASVRVVEPLLAH